MEEKRIAALEREVQRLQKRDRSQSICCIMISVSIIILNVVITRDGWRVDRCFELVNSSISALNGNIDTILGTLDIARNVDGEIIQALEVFQDLMIRIMEGI